MGEATVHVSAPSGAAPASAGTPPVGDEWVARVARAAHPHREAVIAGVRRGITLELPSLQDDELVVALLEASIEENVDTLLHMLGNDIPVERVEAPMAALEYARRLAQREVPVTDLIRAYRLGQARFLGSLLTELGNQNLDAPTVAAATLRIVEATSAYIDKASVAVVRAYQQERERWLALRNATRSNLIRRLLAGEAVDVDHAELELRYRLRGRHLAVIAWTDERAGHGSIGTVEEVIATIGAKMALDDPPLAIPCDRTTWWAWLPIGIDTLTPVAELVEAAGADPDAGAIRLAVGEPASGPEGFVRTHRQATAARTVALAGAPDRPGVTPFAEVGALALMAGDLELTRSWVLDTLGPLSLPRHARLRETLRVYLASSGSFTRTAAVLMLHRNSVQYRLRRAADVRGRGWEDDRLSMELALHACHWFGDRVLPEG